jgi:NAD(P)-dependent dehydrogenase (short-subunit alcohol dehydrogenase family)
VKPTDEDLQTALRVLAALAADVTIMSELPVERRREILAACGQIARPHRSERKKLVKAFRRKEQLARKEADERALDTTGIRAARRAPVFLALPPAVPDEPCVVRELVSARKCYICKVPYTSVHHFYDSMCPSCAELNFTKRHQTADLTNRVALVTGARVKIGYQAALKLLRAGARVIVTTRFPDDAAERYAAEPDHDAFRDRLHIHGLDLRHTPTVERFAQEMLATHERLDYLINNACQTIRRPPGYYAHLGPAPFPQTLAEASLFPPGALDADRQQVDLRPTNSWRLSLSEVSTIELLEVHLCNTIAPFVLNARLKPLMLRPGARSHIINVSAMEGQFYRAFKTDKHPHTNMAKAALNMMTRTSSPDYAQVGIMMNSVDTGWVTDEDPEVIAARKTRVHGFHPPLDIIDGAARILDPIFADLRVHGVFFKDYKPTSW